MGESRGRLYFHKILTPFSFTKLLWFSAFGPHPLLAQSLQELLLRLNRKVRIARVSLPISFLNEGNRIVGGKNLRADQPTPFRSPVRFERDHQMRRESDFFLRYRWQFFALGPRPLLAESAEELLLRPNRELGVHRVLLPIGLFNEGNGVVGDAGLGVDRLTLRQSPTGLY